MKKAVMIIAHQGFRDEELAEPRKVLESAGIEVVIASTSTDTAKGMLGASVKPSIGIGQVDVGDFDAVIFVGGAGASSYWNDPDAHKIVKETVSQGKVLGAICIAPVTLANAGVLNGKKATVWSSEAGQLKKKGAVYTGSQVEQDGNIITASGPKAAKEFGEVILKAIQ